MIDTDRLLGAVTFEPSSATTIFLRYSHMPGRKSLTKRLRRERREAAKRLEVLARRGEINRGVGTTYPFPVYWRSRPGG